MSYLKVIAHTPRGTFENEINPEQELEGDDRAQFISFLKDNIGNLDYLTLMDSEGKTKYVLGPEVIRNSVIEIQEVDNE